MKGIAIVIVALMVVLLLVARWGNIKDGRGGTGDGG